MSPTRRRLGAALLAGGFFSPSLGAEPLVSESKAQQPVAQTAGAAPLSPILPGLGGAPGGGNTLERARARTNEADERRRRAIVLYDEGRLEASLLEFKRAYELAPAYRLLYNIALVSLRLHDYAYALGCFERYLHEGGEEIVPGRRRAVAAHVHQLVALVAFVRVDVNVTGAEVYVDDRVVGRSPLPAPLRLNAGLHRISAQTQRGLTTSHVVEFASGDRASVGLVFLEARREIPWLSWGGTAALAVGAVAAGIQAVETRQDFEGKRRQVGVTRRVLSDAHDAARRWSIAADALGLAALGLGAYSLIVTLQPDESAPETLDGIVPSSLEIELGARGLDLRGTF